MAGVGAASSVPSMSVPVSTNPWSSRWIAGGSQPVRVSVPMSTNSPAAATRARSPVTRWANSSHSSRPSPPPSTTSVSVRTSIRPSASISFTRYADIVAASAPLRATIVTWAA